MRGLATGSKVERLRRDRVDRRVKRGCAWGNGPSVNLNRGAACQPKEGCRDDSAGQRPWSHRIPPPSRYRGRRPS